MKGQERIAILPMLFKLSYNIENTLFKYTFEVLPGNRQPEPEGRDINERYKGGFLEDHFKRLPNVLTTGGSPFAIIALPIRLPCVSGNPFFVTLDYRLSCRNTKVRSIKAPDGIRDCLSQISGCDP